MFEALVPLPPPHDVENSPRAITEERTRIFDLLKMFFMGLPKNFVASFS